jgi:hypothetical protein
MTIFIQLDDKKSKPAVQKEKKLDMVVKVRRAGQDMAAVVIVAVIKVGHPTLIGYIHAFPPCAFWYYYIIISNSDKNCKGYCKFQTSFKIFYLKKCGGCL